MFAVTDLKVCYFLSGWSGLDQEALVAFASSGVDIILRAEDIQGVRGPFDILELLSDCTVHIMSFDVDDKASDLEVALRSARDLGFSHLLQLSTFTPKMSELVLDVKATLAASPESFVCYTPPLKADTWVSRFVTRVLGDPQEDFRDYKTRDCCYPLSALNNFRIKKRTKTDYLAALVFMLKNDVPVLVVPTIELASRKTKDRSVIYSIKVFCYDLWLLALMSFDESMGATKSTLSFSSGVFLACTPFYGLQTLLIVLCCLIFRLSFPIAFIGSQVSLPPTYSLIVAMQFYVGGWLMGRSVVFQMDALADNFELWLVGSLVVGGVLALVLGSFWYWLMFRRLRAD